MAKLAATATNSTPLQQEQVQVQVQTTQELPAHYYKYNGNFRKCAAIQVIFEYFDLKGLIGVQQLNRRFYSYITPGICPRVPLPIRLDFTEQMRQQRERVMLFSRQAEIYTFSQETGYRWVSRPLIVADQETDLESCPTEWPKNCQVSPTEWLFFGGGDIPFILRDDVDRNNQPATKIVTKLDTKTNRLTRMSDMPHATLAHQVIFQSPTAEAPKGTVFCFGGLQDMSHYAIECNRYDVATDKWSPLPEWPNEMYRLSFNLLPLVDNRFILVVSEDRHMLFDTKTSKWIHLDSRNPQIMYQGVQIGAFTLPMAETFNQVPEQALEDKMDECYEEVQQPVAQPAKTEAQIEELMQAKVAQEHIDMIWFGGVGYGCRSEVFHVTLNLKFLKDGPDPLAIQSGLLTFDRLRDRQGKIVNLQQPDRFFYNQEFYLAEPTKELTAMGLGYSGRYTSKFFNKNRYIGVMGREAFHVFDVKQMKFLYADNSNGYRVNLDPKVYDDC